MNSHLPLACLVAFGFAVVTADYGVPAADSTYAAQPVQVNQVPVPAPPQYNQPAYANVAGGRNHGPFLDALINNYGRHKHHKRSRSSSSGSHEHHHHHHHHHGQNWPGLYPGNPYQQEQLLSNPFFVPDHHHHRSSSSSGRRHRRHHRNRSSDSDSSDHSSRSDSSSSSDSSDSHDRS